MGGNTANVPWFMNAGLLVWGLSILACAAALRNVLPGNRWRPLIVGSLALAAGAMVVAALAPMDCSTTVNHACFNRSVNGQASWHEVVHAWAAVAFGSLLAVSSLAVAGFLYSVGRRGLAVLPAVGGTLGIAWTVMGLLNNPRFEPHGHYGVYQRIGLLEASGWIVLLGAAVLWRLDERRARQPGWASAAPPRWSAGRPTRPSA
jgi:hypothetical protein